MESSNASLPQQWKAPISRLPSALDISLATNQIPDIQLHTSNGSQRRASHAEDAMLDQDDRSSSLSDLEDHLATGGTDNQGKPPPLSEDEEDDTEAETERLEQTPQKSRKRKNVLLSSTNQFTERSTTPLLAEEDNEPLSSRPSDALLVDDRDQHLDPIDQSIDHNSDISSLGDYNEEISRPISPMHMPGKKRKRTSQDSQVKDEDVTAESLKRVAAHLENHVADRQTDPVALLNGDEQENDDTIEDEGSGDDVGDWPDENPPKDEIVNNEEGAAGDGNDSNGEDIDMEDINNGVEVDATARSEEERMFDPNPQLLGYLCFSTIQWLIFYFKSSRKKPLWTL
jgi:hypothetical protein